MTYTPDKWVLVRVHFDEKTEVKVLGGWSGGYLDGDSWRLSSGVTKIKDCDEYWEITNYSGSIYHCYKQSEGCNVISGGILQKLIDDKRGELENIKKIYGYFKLQDRPH